MCMYTCMYFPQGHMGMGREWKDLDWCVNVPWGEGENRQIRKKKSDQKNLPAYRKQSLLGKIIHVYVSMQKK